MSEQLPTWRPSLRQEQPGIWSWTCQWVWLNSLCQCMFLSLFQLNGMICSIWQTRGLAVIQEERTQGERGQTLLSNTIKGSVRTNDEPMSLNLTFNARERGLTSGTHCCCCQSRQNELLYPGVWWDGWHPPTTLGESWTKEKRTCSWLVEHPHAHVHDSILYFTKLSVFLILLHFASIPDPNATYTSLTRKTEVTAEFFSPSVSSTIFLKDLPNRLQQHLCLPSVWRQHSCSEKGRSLCPKY